MRRVSLCYTPALHVHHALGHQLAGRFADETQSGCGGRGRRRRRGGEGGGRRADVLIMRGCGGRGRRRGGEGGGRRADVLIMKKSVWGRMFVGVVCDFECWGILLGPQEGAAA